MQCQTEICLRRAAESEALHAAGSDCGINAERIVLVNERERLRNVTIYLSQCGSQYEAKSTQFK